MNAQLALNPTTETLVTYKPSLIGLTLEELQALAAEMGEPKFRADQLHNWLYVKCVRSFEAMTNLKKEFRAKLAERFTLDAFEVAEKQVSSDGTVKYLFRLNDGQLIESVLMYFEERDTYAMCLSSQVGCAVNCGFCATGKLGFKRHLSVAEIVNQYVYVQGETGVEVRNVVFMGQGEPLLNYDNLMSAIRILNRSAEVGMRRMTISTSGIVPRIYDLAKEEMDITLAISLHAPDNDTRTEIMPLNQKWPLEELIPALQHYIDVTGNRVTAEYILLAGLNDSVEQGKALGDLLKPLKCNVNLIPYNPIGDSYGYKRPSNNAIHRFKDAVGTSGKKVTIRVERGADIDAACGQLANKVQQAEATSV